MQFFTALLFLSFLSTFSHFCLAIDAMTNVTVQAAAGWTSCNDSVVIQFCVKTC